MIITTFGALIGGLVGDCNLYSTIEFMVNDAKDITPFILRVLASVFLAATLIKTVLLIEFLKR